MGGEGGEQRKGGEFSEVRKRAEKKERKREGRGINERGRGAFEYESNESTKNSHQIKRGDN